MSDIINGTNIGDAGNSTATSSTLVGSGINTVTGSVGGIDTNDYYKFVAASTGNANLILSGLSADVDLKLLNSAGTQFASSATGGTSNETISFAVTAGQTYYVQVAPYLAAVSNYNLSVSLPAAAPVDVTAPIFTSLSPADETGNVAVGANIVITFNEAVRAGNGNIHIANLTRGGGRDISITDTSQVNISGNTITINPTTDLSSGNRMEVTLGTGAVLDSAGNSFAGLPVGALNFTTASITPPVGQPDLTISSFLLNSTSITQGNAMVASYTIGNIGTSTTTATTLGVYLDGVKQYSINVAAISANGSQSGTVFLSDLSVGTHSVLIKADDPNTITESNESNNASSQVVTVTAAAATPPPPPPVQPDLTSLVTLVSNSVVKGNNFTFSYSVQNIGTGAADASTLGIYVDNAKQSTVTSIASLGVGGAISSTYDLNTSNLTAGSHTITVRADDSSVIAESNENNNVSPLQNFMVTASVTDTASPIMTSTNPADESGRIAPSSNIVLTFNEAVKVGSGVITISNLTKGGSRTIDINDSTGQIGFSGSTMTINPSTDLSDGNRFEVTFGSGVVKDLAGNNFAGISTGALNFTTADTTAPTIVSATPFKGDNAPVDSNIVLKFSETVQKGSGDIIISNLSSGGERVINVESTLVRVVGDTMTIDPGDSLKAGSMIGVKFGSGVVLDSAGNSYAGLTTFPSDQALRFVTDDAAVPVRLPFDASSLHKVAQTYDGNFSHGDSHMTWSIDFSNAIDSNVLSVASGEVVFARDDIHDGNDKNTFDEPQVWGTHGLGNYVTIKMDNE